LQFLLAVTGSAIFFCSEHIEITDHFGEPRTSKITPTLLVPILRNFRHIFAMMNLPDPEPMMSLDKFWSRPDGRTPLFGAIGNSES